MEEARRRARPGPADDEERVLVVEPEERVERHHEASLRLGAAPLARDPLELAAQVLADLSRPQHLGAVAGALEPVDRLAHLADRPALERERRRLDHRLVAVVEGMQAVRPVEREPVLRGAEDRDPPVALVGRTR